MLNIEEHYRNNADFIRIREGVLNGAFTQTIRGKLTRCAYKHLNNWEDAEDAVQNTYERALMYLPSYKGGSLDDWMFIILMNSLNRIKRNKSEEPELIEADDSIPVDEYLSVADNLENGLELERYGDKFEELFSGLSIRDASVLRLHHLYGHTMPVIGGLLSLPLTTVQNVVHRNRGLLDRLKERTLDGGVK